jgi:hypothetical protein
MLLARFITELNAREERKLFGRVLIRNSLGVLRGHGVSAVSFLMPFTAERAENAENSLSKTEIRAVPN